MEESHEREECTLVARKPCFGLPTACPICLPVYIYLKLARLPFRLDFNSTYPDSDQIPYVESGAYVAYNNESGGVIQRLKEDGIVNLDTEFCSIPEWISMKAMISSWLVDAVMYELWLGSDGSSAFKIYYSDLPWLIGKVLFVKQAYTVKQQLGITKENAERREEEIYKRVKIAYGALSTRLGEQEFLFEDRPSSLDALFLGHSFHSSSITCSKPKRKPKREKTEEEKTFKRRAKYFLATQVVAILLFLSVMGGYDFSEVEVGDDDEGYGYD
ncbi:hypothetical protein GH714_038660 [Hevea brasiliensis]|uniref:Metaxin n=1 Tax=Hevea brasiliensis TaxID=3981 RepID=A0A6A6LQR0_HEVBR|nr:hypothetical protein GH714_038660 [Hevea brasiliensis]